MLARLTMHFAKPRSSYLSDIVRVLSGNGLGQAIALASLPFLSRIFSPRDFAVQNLFVQFVGFSSVVLTWRYEYLIALPDREARALALQRLVFLSAMVGVVAGTPVVSMFRQELAGGLGEPELAAYLPMALASAGLLSIGMASQNLMQRRQSYRLSSLSEVASKAGYVLVAFAGGWLLMGAWGLVLATAGGAIAKIVSLWIARESRGDPQPSIGGRDIIDGAAFYRKLAGSISLSHVLMTATGAIPSIFIAHAYGREELGQFALVATTLFLPSALLGNALGQVYLQRAAAAWARGSSFLGLWTSTVYWLLLAGGVTYLAAWVLAGWLYPLVFGAQWSHAGAYATILVPAAFFSFLTSPLDRGSLVVGAWKYVLAWHTFRAATTGVLALVAERSGWPLERFLLGLSIQMSLCYLIDLYAGRGFATREPPVSQRADSGEMNSVASQPKSKS